MQCVLCVCTILARSKESIRSLEFEFMVVVNCYVGARSKSWVLCTSHKLLKHLQPLALDF